MMRKNWMTRLGSLAAFLLLFLAVAACSNNGNDGSDGTDGAQGPTGSQGDPGPAANADDGTSLESCVGCHGAGGVLPVASISAPGDAHHIDTDPDGPATSSGYRQLRVALSSVDVSGSNVVILFDVEDENMNPVADLFAADGRFTIAKLLPPPTAGDANR